MTRSTDDRDHARIDHRHPENDYCTYCGAKLTDEADAAAGLGTDVFCDEDCEETWNIDASASVASPSRPANTSIPDAE